MLAGASGCASLEAARLYQTGSQALEQGQTDLAIQDLERAADLLPRASEVQNHLGIAYLEAGRTADAEGAFRRAVDLDCTNAAAVRNLRVVEARAVDSVGTP